MIVLLRDGGCQSCATGYAGRSDGAGKATRMPGDVSFDFAREAGYILPAVNGKAAGAAKKRAV
jgi:hypothetical protein